MFTRKFVKLPIKTFDKEHMELTGEELVVDTYEMINPFHIQSYRPSDENRGKAVNLTFKDGSSILIYMSINNFEKTLDEHVKINS
jgi:hypothetical protein